MLTIGICTKRDSFRKHIGKVLKSILFGYGEWKIQEVSAQKLLEKNRECILDCHMLCVDEQLLKEQGMQLVAFASRVRPDATILLLEGVEEQGISKVRYHLFAYHLQRMKEEDLQQEFVRQWNRHNGSSRHLDIVVEGECVSVLLDEIIYIESNNRHVILHTLQGDYEYNEKMYILESLLSEDGFVRCHQSYIVSKRFVTDYNSMEIKLDAISVPIGRKYKEQVYNVFGSFSEIGIDDKRETLSEKQGELMCENGIYEGTIIRFRPEQTILIGRDAKLADIVVNLPKVSRLHCMIVFHEKDNLYEIVDFSKNGTYINGEQRMVSDTSYVVKTGTRVSFGDVDNVYCLI